MIYVAHVAGWVPYNLHGPGHVSWVGYVLYRSCTQQLKTARQDLDDLDDLHGDSVRRVAEFLERWLTETERDRGMTMVDDWMIYWSVRCWVGDLVDVLLDDHWQVFLKPNRERFRWASLYVGWRLVVDGWLVDVCVLMLHTIFFSIILPVCCWLIILPDRCADIRRGEKKERVSC
ncbi:unnamed protein product [Laminaria digitata]